MLARKTSLKIGNKSRLFTCEQRPSPIVKKSKGQNAVPYGKGGGQSDQVDDRMYFCLFSTIVKAFTEINALK